MSTSFSPTPNALRVDIKPSNYFYAALIAVASMAIAAIFYARLSWLPRGFSILSVCLYASYCGYRQRRQRGVLQWHSGWSWIDAGGNKHTLQLRHVTVWPGLIALQFCALEHGRRIAFTLLPDSFVSADDARRLRLYLHHFPVFEKAG